MDNTTNIIYNIKAIDDATAVINSVRTSLTELRRIKNVTIRIKTVYDTRNNITNTVKDVYKASASVSATMKRTLVDTYKTVETHQTNVINKNKTINDQLNRTRNITSDVSKNTEKVNSHSSKWLKNVASILKRYISLRKTIDFIVKSVKESAEWTENIHLFDVAFEYKEATKEAYAFGKTISDTFNTSINETMRYLSVFRQMTDAIGIADATADRMSKTLTALGYDIASLYNISIESAMEKLEAGIAGQTKPLRTLGMDITAQSLDNYLEQELKLANVTSKQMTQADKMILRTIVIMDQAKNAYGDMAETLHTFSNQVKVMQGAYSNFKLALGDLIKSYMQPFVTYTAGILIAITNIIRAFVPLEDTSGIDKLKNSLVGVDDELQDIAETAGLLSFDKFNALTKGNEGGINAGNITSLLEQVLGTKYEEYMVSFNESLEKATNGANDVAKAITSWVFPDVKFDADGTIESLGEINFLLKSIFEVLKWIVAIKVAGLLGKLTISLSTTAYNLRLLSFATEGFTLTAGTMKKTLQSLSGVLAVVLIYQIIDLIAKWKDLDAWGKTWRIGLIAIVGVLWFVGSGLHTTTVQLAKFSFQILKNVIPAIWDFITAIGTKLVAALKSFGSVMSNTVFPAMLKFMGSTGGLIVGIATLSAGIGYYISSLDKMSTTAKILIPIIAALSAVFVGLAVAKAAASAGIAAPVMAGITAAAITAGIVLAAGTAMSVGKYEQGGLPEKGHLFIANENGNPELVGNIGGNTAVANNDMIVTAIENAAFRGFVRAIDTTQSSSKSSSKPIVLNINGREFARATATDMADEFGRRNIKMK